MKVTMFTKPLSVNQAFQGKRFKSPLYKSYEKELMMTLPKLVEIPKGKLTIFIDVGYSNSQADIDNCIKPFVDILQKKYGFNDNRIYKMIITKYVVKKGNEFISFELEAFEE